MAVKRTFGWVQNPGDLKKLKKVVGIFKAGSAENLDLVSNKLPLLLTYGLISNDDYNDFIAELNKTDIEIDYSKLKGKGSGSRTRKDAICTGIIQAIIEAQQNKTYSDVAGNSITIKKPYTDDWTAEGFLRWAISCGLLEYVKDDDKCKITPLGEELANAPDNSPAETEALTKALLSYPPVIRILSLLEAQDEQTKFDLGSKLGFKGEMGFTSMPQDAYFLFLFTLSNAAVIQRQDQNKANHRKYAQDEIGGHIAVCQRLRYPYHRSGKGHNNIPNGHDYG